jgi:putative transcription antitermination factor YqgF
MGIDYGGRRIGIAVSESGLLATPHSVIENDDRALERLAGLAAELEAQTIVVGVARRARTRDGEEKFVRFADDLRQKTCKSVILWDESLSTIEAERRLRDSGRRSRGDIDMYAAAVILQSYLDQSGRKS